MLVPTAPVSGVVPDVKVEMRDFAFVPSSVLGNVNASYVVHWDNVGSQTHNATDGSGFVDTGDVPAADFELTYFDTAGVFLYRCTIHPEMKGSISIPPRASVATVSKGTPFTLTWAYASIPGGFNIDIQVRKPHNGGTGASRATTSRRISTTP